MSDFGKTDAKWERYLGREYALLQLGPFRFLREAAERFRGAREQVRPRRDYSSFLDDAGGGATFAGAIPGVNTTERCSVYVRLTGNGAARVVSAYMETGGSGLVAQAAAVADGDTATLTAQNGSGLTATWEVPSSAANTTGDELEVDLVPDYPLLPNRVLDLTEDDDAPGRKVYEEAFEFVHNQLLGAANGYRSFWERMQLADGTRNPVARGNAFGGGLGQTVLLSESIARNPTGSGEVERERSGLFVQLEGGMEDETTGAEQFVLDRDMTGAAGVFGGDNVGLGSVAAHTPGEQCPASRWVFRCVDETIGSEAFQGSYTVTEGGQERTVVVDALCFIGQQFEGPIGFGPIVPTRTYSKTDANSRFEAATGATAPTVSGETDENTDDGDLHIEIVANGGNWDVEFYRRSTRTDAHLVAKATGVATGATFTATEQNASGLEVDWELSGTVAADATPILHLNTFRIDDEFTVTVTVGAGKGLIQTWTGIAIPGAKLHSADAGVTISDDYIRACSFAPYSVEYH